MIMPSKSYPSLHQVYHGTSHLSALTWTIVKASVRYPCISLAHSESVKTQVKSHHSSVQNQCLSISLYNPESLLWPPRHCISKAPLPFNSASLSYATFLLSHSASASMASFLVLEHAWHFVFSMDSVLAILFA